ncbi:membrane-spanning 4-domains subfamily A member 4D [Amia ocellicauda]|uniref:membrane-spanning 4-domains subfamily A member 4D n=1 Tax=Amia ocellicauda TaxID=2972642 RepID=UPI00346422F3
MAVSVTKGDGVVVFSVTSDPTSNWPVLCQLLGSLCCSPFCLVSRSLRRFYSGTQASLGTVQIMVGLINIGLGVILQQFDYYESHPFWLGGMFIAAGVMCVFADRFPNPCLVSLTVCTDLVSAMLAVTAIVLYSVNLANRDGLYYFCRFNDDGYHRSWYATTTSPNPEDERIQQMNKEKCLEVKHMLQVTLRGLRIMLIVVSVLQLCVALSAATLGIKCLCRNKREPKPLSDVELSKPLLEEDTDDPEA